MSIPVSFEDAFKRIRAHLVKKIDPSTLLLNLMIDTELLTSWHVEEIQVYRPITDSSNYPTLDPRFSVAVIQVLFFREVWKLVSFHIKKCIFINWFRH